MDEAEKRRDLERRKAELQERLNAVNSAEKWWERAAEELRRKAERLKGRKVRAEEGEKMLHYVLNREQIVRAQKMVRRWIRRRHDSEKETRKATLLDAIGFLCGFFGWLSWVLFL